MPVASLKSHDLSYECQTARGAWRWTTRMNTAGPSPTFTIVDIVSPYGLLRDSIPLPGEVVTKMAESITTMASAFSPRILLSSGSITITLDEGRGFGVAQTVTVTNNGSFGSVLAAALTSSVGYVKVTPANLTGLAAQSSGSFQVNADSTSLLASGSPYSASVAVQDASATNTPQTLSVTVVVRAKATITLSPDELLFNVGGPPGGPWPAIPPQTFTLTNTGPAGSVLDFQIEKLMGPSAWLTSFTPSFGTLGSNAGLNVTVAVAPIPYMLPGVYEEYLRISGYSSNLHQDLLVTLTIT